LSLLDEQAGSAPTEAPPGASDDLLDLAHNQVYELNEFVQNAVTEMEAAFRA